MNPRAKKKGEKEGERSIPVFGSKSKTEGRKEKLIKSTNQSWYY